MYHGIANDALKDSLEIKPKNTRRKKRPWFSPFLCDLKKKMHEVFTKIKTLARKKQSPNANLLARYTSIRALYHKYLKSEEYKYVLEGVGELIDSVENEGLVKIYKSAKSIGGTECIDLEKFLKYCKKLFSSECDQNPNPIASCENDSHPVTVEITVEEVLGSLGKFKSKAKSISGLSTADLKSIKTDIAPYLTRYYNLILRQRASFSKAYLESALFFLFKGEGEREPENHRTIFVQNPILKTFMSVLKNRIANFAESEKVYPPLQFGFRTKRSTFAATAILHQIVKERLDNKKRTYCCFIDLRKCFDSIDRSKLFKKLQIVGLPYRLCEIIHEIYSNLRSTIRSGSFLSDEFLSEIGLLQGCCLSSVLFLLFAFDIESCFSHKGINLGKYHVQFLMFADDLVLICETAEELQEAINNFMRYCDENGLTLNAKKTKVVIFHKGRAPKASFTAGEKQLDVENSFKYLGFNVTCQLSFTKHAEYLNVKARSKIGYLFAKLPLRELPLKIVLDIWNIYILPIYRYGLPMWLSKCSDSVLKEIDSVFLKYVKIYLGVPRHANNAITYFITETEPFSHTLKRLAPQCLGGLTFPEEFDGVNLDFLNLSYTCTYNVYEDIPSWFWVSRTFFAIPRNSGYRKKLCRQIYDLDHTDFCSNTKFHHKVLLGCTCRYCGKRMSNYHSRICTGNNLRKTVLALPRLLTKDYKNLRQPKIVLPNLTVKDCQNIRQPKILLTPIKTDPNIGVSQNSKRKRIKNKKYLGDEWTI